jgi:hypothetical protein
MHSEIISISGSCSHINVNSDKYSFKKVIYINS